MINKHRAKSEAQFKIIITEWIYMVYVFFRVGGPAPRPQLKPIGGHFLRRGVVSWWTITARRAPGKMAPGPEIALSGPLPGDFKKWYVLC
jgi:hypothetical protein